MANVLDFACGFGCLLVILGISLYTIKGGIIALGMLIVLSCILIAWKESRGSTDKPTKTGGSTREL